MGKMESRNENYGMTTKTQSAIVNFLEICTSLDKQNRFGVCITLGTTYKDGEVGSDNYFLSTKEFTLLKNAVDKAHLEVLDDDVETWVFG